MPSPFVGAPPPRNIKAQHEHARHQADRATGKTQDHGERQWGAATRDRLSDKGRWKNKLEHSQGWQGVPSAGLRWPRFAPSGDLGCQYNIMPGEAARTGAEAIRRPSPPRGAPEGGFRTVMYNSFRIAPPGGAEARVESRELVEQSLLAVSGLRGRSTLSGTRDREPNGTTRQSARFHSHATSQSN